MTIALGPPPAPLQALLQEWAQKEPWDDPVRNPYPEAIILFGGPSHIALLDVDGRVWNYDPSDESLQGVVDGPMKVFFIAVAARHRPALRTWLPTRPSTALDCMRCGGSGWMGEGGPGCHFCWGLGWIPEPDDAEPKRSIGASPP